jgi:NAD(P)-dependent dehydrogenase (short-subunit alcohol dehydrogenase family)
MMFKHANIREASCVDEARGKAERPTEMTEEKMPKLDGKIAVITGGNSGIGLATAKVFVKKGARVYITGRRQAELEAAARPLFRVMSPSRADLDRLYGQIREEVGRVDVVFANAGVISRCHFRFGSCMDGARGARGI